MARKLAHLALVSGTAKIMAAFPAASHLFLTDMCRTILHSLLFF